MQDLYRHFGNLSLWEAYDVPMSPVIEVTEAWVSKHDSRSPALVEARTISSTGIESWLEEPPHKYFPAGAYTRSIRLVWVGQDPQTGRSSPSSGILERLTDAWVLRDALNYARSCFAGVSAPEPQGDTRVFTVTYHPKLAAAWSYNESGSEGSAETHAIIFAEGEERVELRRILTSEWSSESATHAMFPALLCGLMLAHELDSTLEDIKAAVREVEARTGHHRFTTRRQTQPAAGELGHLSAQMSGCAAKLANGTRKMKVVEAINDFIDRHTCYRGHTGTTNATAHATLRLGDCLWTPHLDLLRHRVRMQIQIAALFHLIAQQDNAIAFDTASATRSIAASSLQDSSSMKMLALVAMFFLPGSFVAALFSTPLFAWEEAAQAAGAGDISVGTRPQFALFWAVTVPLTVLVFVLYALWMCAQKKRERRKGPKDFGLQDIA
ncbi:hypothetical protein VTK56DRAFT_9222 [Thermocarpiscus australiensis]